MEYAMKKIIILIFLVVFAVCGVAAQNNNPFATGMQSTAPSMMQSGSSYTPQVTPPGAAAPITSAQDMNPTRRRNAFDDIPDPNTSKDSPIGEPVALLVFAAAAGVAVYLRRRTYYLK